MAKVHLLVGVAPLPRPTDDDATIAAAEQYGSDLFAKPEMAGFSRAWYYLAPGHIAAVWRAAIDAAAAGDWLVVCNPVRSLHSVDHFRQVRSDVTRRGAKLHVAGFPELSEPGRPENDEVARRTMTDALDRLHRQIRSATLSAATKRALDAKRRRGEKLGGFGPRPGYEVARVRQFVRSGFWCRLDGKPVWVKYLVPDFERLPLLRLVAYLRDGCLARKSRRTWERSPVEIVPAYRARELPDQPGWGGWHQPSWDIISDRIEALLAKREGREARPRLAWKDQREWTPKRLKAGYEAWREDLSLRRVVWIGERHATRGLVG